jgi:hypothetical protein
MDNRWPTLFQAMTRMCCLGECVKSLADVLVLGSDLALCVGMPYTILAAAARLHRSSSRDNEERCL